MDCVTLMRVVGTAYKKFCHKPLRERDRLQTTCRIWEESVKWQNVVKILTGIKWPRIYSKGRFC